MSARLLAQSRAHQLGLKRCETERDTGHIVAEARPGTVIVYGSAAGEVELPKLRAKTWSEMDDALAKSKVRYARGSAPEPESGVDALFSSFFKGDEA